MTTKGADFAPLNPHSLVPGRAVNIAPESVLTAALAKAQLLQKARDQGALTTLISLFANQKATVVDSPTSVESDGMCKIRTNVGTTASLPNCTIGVDPDQERQHRLRFERSLVHDLAASTIAECWRFAKLRRVSKREAQKRRVAREEAAAVEAAAAAAEAAAAKAAALAAHRLVVEELAAVAIQAFARGVAARRQYRAMLIREATRVLAVDEEDPVVVAAATRLGAAFRGTSVRRQQDQDYAQQAHMVSQQQLESGVDHTGAMLVACAAGDLHAAHVLRRDHGCSVHGADAKGNSGLVLAAAGGHLDVVRFLCSAGASLTVPNQAGWTPLHRACFNGHLDVATFLLEKLEAARVPSKVVHAANNFGSTPLHVAIPNGHLDVVELLVQRGAPLEALNASGDSPLHFAVVCRQPAIVRFLLAENADATTTCNAEGRTPAESAAEIPELAALFDEALKRGSQETTRLLLAAGPEHSNEGQIKSRRSEGANKSAVDQAKADEKARKAMRAKRSSSERGHKDDDDEDVVARRASLKDAWQAATDETCEFVALREHEAATVLNVLGVNGVIHGPKDAQQRADVLLRLDSSENLREDLCVAASRLCLGSHDDVTARQSQTCRKKLLALMRSPRGASKFIMERPHVASWSDSMGRVFLKSCLEVPSQAVDALTQCDGEALMALDEDRLADCPDLAALPSILKQRLLFHAALLRHCAQADTFKMTSGASNHSEAPPLPASSNAFAGPTMNRTTGSWEPTITTNSTKPVSSAPPAGRLRPSDVAVVGALADQLSEEAPPPTVEPKRALYRTNSEPSAKQHVPQEDEEERYVDGFGTQLPYVPAEMLADARVSDRMNRADKFANAKAKKPTIPTSQPAGAAKAVTERPKSAHLQRRASSEMPTSSRREKPQKGRPQTANNDRTRRPSSATGGGRRRSWTPVNVQTFDFRDPSLPVDHDTSAAPREQMQHANPWRPAGKSTAVPRDPRAEEKEPPYPGAPIGEVQVPRSRLHARSGGSRHGKGYRQRRGGTFERHDSQRDGAMRQGVYPGHASMQTGTQQTRPKFNDNEEDSGRTLMESAQMESVDDDDDYNFEPVRGGGYMEDCNINGGHENRHLDENEVRERIGDLVEDRLYASMNGGSGRGGNDDHESRGGWSQSSDDFRTNQAEAEREELRRLDAIAEARAQKTQAKHERDNQRKRRPTSSNGGHYDETPDATLRRQMADMEEQMMRKEREVRAALKRNRVNSTSATAKKAAAAATHRKRRDDLFRNDVAAAVDERIRAEERRQRWEGGDKEVEELAAALDAASEEVATHREKCAQVKAKVQKVAMSQASVEKRLSQAHAAIGALKVSKPEGASKFHELEQEVEDLFAMHERQLEHLDEASNKLARLQRHLQRTARHSIAHVDAAASAQSLDSDTAAFYGVDRKSRLVQKQLQGLEESTEELASKLKARQEVHTDLAGQLSVAQMTIKAMRSVLRDFSTGV